MGPLLQVLCQAIRLQYSVAYNAAHNAALSDNMLSNVATVRLVGDWSLAGNILPFALRPSQSIL